MLVSYLYFCIAVSDFLFDILAKINIKAVTAVAGMAAGFVGNILSRTYTRKRVCIRI